MLYISVCTAAQTSKQAIWKSANLLIPLEYKIITSQLHFTLSVHIVLFTKHLCKVIIQTIYLAEKHIENITVDQQLFSSSFAPGNSAQPIPQTSY